MSSLALPTFRTRPSPRALLYPLVQSLSAGSSSSHPCPPSTRSPRARRLQSSHRLYSLASSLPRSSIPCSSTPRPLSLGLSSGWSHLGVPEAVLDRLAETYPHVLDPTPAQRALLLTLHKGLDVFLKDHMGRGKTLALALAALSLTHQPSNQVLILVPTLHLQNQVERYLSDLAPSSSSTSFEVISPSSPSPRLESGIILSTPRALLPHCPDLGRQRQPHFLPDLTHIILDEPDTMLSPLPPSHLVGRDASRHPFFRHPPDLVPLLDSILCIRSRGGYGRPTAQGDLDWSDRRNDVATCWIGAGINTPLRRWVRTRGWVRAQQGSNEQGDGSRSLVNLDYTDTASIQQQQLAKSLDDVYRAMSKSPREASVISETEPADVDHYTLVVDSETGDYTQLDPHVPPQLSPTNPTSLPPDLVEALAMMHTTAPPPPGSDSLVLPPEGTSLDAIVQDLVQMGVNARVLLPVDLRSASGALDTYLELESTDRETGVVLVAPRSSVPGLHLPKLHTVYCLSGLDVASLSPGQKKRGGGEGLKGRVAFYEVISGRLTRLGMGAFEDKSGASELSGEEVEGEGEGTGKGRRKVVSLVMKGSEEEVAMWNMVHGSLRRG